LEDAGTGEKRPALIDRVEVEIEQASRIPQLVVTLRYDDEDAHASEIGTMESASQEIAPPPELEGMGAEARASDDEDAGEGAADKATGEAGDAMEPSEEMEPAHAKSAPENTSKAAPPAEAVEAEIELPMKGAFARGAAQIGPMFDKWSKHARLT